MKYIKDPILIIALIMVITGITLIIASKVNAGELEAIVLSSTKVTERYDQGAGAWGGVQINYVFNDGMYLFGTKENIDVLLLGGKAWQYDIMGVGVGFKYQINKRVRLFGQVGYYRIKNSWGKYQRHENNEAILYALNEKYNNTGSTQSFDAYSVDTSTAAPGIALGVELAYPINRHWTTGFVLSYRQIKIEEDYSGYNHAWGCPHNTTECDKWQSTRNEDYSSINIGFNLRYTF